MKISRFNDSFKLQKYQDFMNYVNPDKVEILKSIKPVFSDLLMNQICFVINYFMIFFAQVKISKDLSPKYYQDNNERQREYGHEQCKNLLEDEIWKLVEYGKKIR